MIKRILYLFICVFLLSCRTEETTAFWFKKEENKRTGYITHVTNNLKITLSSIISTNQAHQGMNTNLGLRAITDQNVIIDSIRVRVNILNKQVTPIVSNSFAESVAIEYPITLKPNEFKQYSILLLNQEDYKIEIGDSLNLKIEIHHTKQEEKTVNTFEAKKYFETWRYTIML